MKNSNETPESVNPQERIGDWVLYKNNQLIAFNKPAGIPTQTDKTGDKSLLQLAEIFTKSAVQLVHRLDRPASGIVLVSKTAKALANLNEQFRNRQIQKTYLAVVEALPTEPKGRLEHWIWKNGQTNRSVISTEKGHANAQEAILEYQLLGSSDRYHLLEVKLLTGRHHQIRAQLAAMGCIIKGDVKYGARRSNKDRSIHLHAWKLSFQHPVSHETVVLTAPLPVDSVWDAMGAFLGS
ncbi:MAG TPA: RNA pseudouridine synthase [Haliscomenobacter sp.]|uniref:RluA family pseudouridine synthase n=1 Tax=Haliscomenobacter sp. TaxID=2717303 RepID=UPI002C00893F|nr:RNA pseudouridine synthase [Haliscomenobacter sp.]HOY17595.1 RNA pseudouridine synthase [Haliscomenobacter sp.]HPH18559.1 RNA pseudouridine synthase [Haliscomenobacter sp.]